MLRLVIALKFIILITGFICTYVLLCKCDNANSTGLGIAAAGCFIAFALIENNDVKEINKD